MEILHDFSLAVGAGQSLCLIGPNGAGKSTVLHSIFGFTNIFSAAAIRVGGKDVTRLKPNDKLRSAGHRLHPAGQLGLPRHDGRGEPVDGRLPEGHAPIRRRRRPSASSRSTTALAARRSQPARVLSGGERRLLEISRALVMEPEVLLVDEPSIGLEPRFIDMVFEILDDLQRTEGKTIIMVEQNAKKGLEFADLGYVLVSGQLAKAGLGDELLEDPDVGRLFLGG